MTKIKDKQWNNDVKTGEKGKSMLQKYINRHFPNLIVQAVDDIGQKKYDDKIKNYKVYRENGYLGVGDVFIFNPNTNKKQLFEVKTRTKKRDTISIKERNMKEQEDIPIILVNISPEDKLLKISYGFISDGFFTKHKFEGGDARCSAEKYEVRCTDFRVLYEASWNKSLNREEKISKAKKDFLAFLDNC
jgi:hypothetical protein